MKICTRLLLATACLIPIAAFAQTATWIGGTSNNNFSAGTNWQGGVAPAANADLEFSTTVGNTLQVGFNNLPYTANSITFNNGSSSAPFFINGNGSTLSIAGGGITTASGSGGAVFSSSFSMALAASQTWSTATNLTVNSVVGGTGVTLTKSGTGYLSLTGNNTFDNTSTISVSAGSLYLGQDLSAGSASISVGASGTLGTNYNDVSVSNSVTLASGATLVGTPSGSSSEIDFNGAVTLSSATTTLNIGHGDVNFTSSLTGPTNTALTFHASGNGAAILTGTTSNITSIVADNAAVAIGATTALTGINSIAATNGGYVSAVYAGGSSPSAADVVAKVTSPSSFDGTLGFDTADNISAPHTYDLTGLDLSGFTNSNFALGTATNAILTGTISTPQQDYHFRGFGDHGGGFFVQSNLADKNSTTSNIIVTSPNSGGAVAGGIYVILQGNNTLTGSLSVTDSAVILDSATALPSKDFSLAANSYAGYTETATGVTAYTSFADFAAHATSYDSAGGTSVLGLDSHGPLADFASGGSGSASRTVSLAADGDINLSTNFTKIYLGTVSGVTIASDVAITAPLDGVLRLVNMGGDIGNFNINAPLNSGNVTSVVVGMDGSEGVVALNAASNYTGGTTLNGGTLLVGNDRALGLTSSGLTVSSSISGAKFGLGASSNGILLDNAIAVTGNLSIGQGYVDEMDSTIFHSDSNLLTLSGAISGSGRLYITGATTLSGNNTYSGGTYIEADTTVSSNTGLGTNFVDLAYGRTLTFTAANPIVGGLADAGQFMFNAGTGTINFSGTSTFTVSQNTTTTYSGSFTGSTPTLTKEGIGTLFLTGANAGKFSSTTVTGGALSIGNGQASGVTFDSNITMNGGSLNFQPAGGQTIAYSGSIGGTSGSVSINGSSTGSVNVTGVGSSFSGSTSINSGTLTIGTDNAWSSASATTVSSGASVALQLNGSQTFKNLSGSGKINIASGKTLTVDSFSGTNLSGVISGSGNLAKTGTSSLTLMAANTYTGSTTISGGTLVLGSGSALATQSQIILDGGTLALGSFSPAAFTNGLAMSASSFIDFGGGSDTLAFGDSSAATWTGTLTLMNFTVGSDFLRFGASASGLSGPELAQISLAGYTVTGLDGSGYVQFSATAIPEPATYAALLGLAGLALAAWRRRRVA